MEFVAAAVLSYLAGSVPFGYLIALRRGLDIRTAGSGNIGATNVSRQLGRKIGALVFVLDFAKGALPTWLALAQTHDVAIAAVAGTSAILGHLFPIWLRFRGGKGVATGTGVVLVLLPIPGAVGLVVWLATLSATRFVALASMFAGIAVCGVQLIVSPAPLHGEQRILTLFSLAACVLVLIRHAGNIVRLAADTEHQVSESSGMRSLGRIIHVLALGLWFGSNVFFTFVAAVLIFKTWDSYGEAPPTWMPTMSKDTGTRIAGATVGPIFPFFFAVQALCSVLCLITAVGFSRGEPGRAIHRLRFYVILLAALTVVASWPLNVTLADLREQRYDRNPAVAEPARAQFGKLHMVSLFLNFGTIGLVTIATAMAAFLPAHQKPFAASQE